MNVERVPTFDEMMQPLIEVLKDKNKECTVEELREAVAHRLRLTDAQLTIMHKPDSSDRRSRFEYNLAWTCTYLKNAGYLNNPRRGKWSLTTQGHSVDNLDVDMVKRKVRTYRGGNKGDPVTIPSPQDEVDADELENQDEQGSLHTEIQWLLLKLGQDMGLDIWIANNDRGKSFDGQRFELQKRLLRKLPQRFTEATQKTIELIDVLWLRGQQIIAAFEIENTTSIYSGLLRLSDLVAMQPDIDIPMYVVAPEERQRKVTIEINRPTFSMATDLANRCRYISYTKLREAVARVEGLITHLSPSFIHDYSVNVTTRE